MKTQCAVCLHARAAGRNAKGQLLFRRDCPARPNLDREPQPMYDKSKGREHRLVSSLYVLRNCPNFDDMRDGGK